MPFVTRKYSIVAGLGVILVGIVTDNEVSGVVDVAGGLDKDSIATVGALKCLGSCLKCFVMAAATDS